MKSNNCLKNIINIMLIPLITISALVILVLILSDTPARTLYFFFVGPFSNIFSFSNMVNYSIILIFGALAVTIAMKAGSLNLGGEGQIYLGAFITAITALEVSNLAVFAIFLSLAAGVLFSAILASFSGFCKIKWQTSELITTYLFACAAIPIINYFISGPFLDTKSSLQSTGRIAENLRLGLIFKPYNINTGIIISVVFILIMHIFIKYTKKGYEFRIAGYNEMFARYGGINTKLNTILAMAISGGLYGLAGGLAVMGTYHAAIKEFSMGMGWNGLTVALIAGFNIPAIIPASLFFAWITAGARVAMQNTGLTFEIAGILQAFILFISTSIVIKNYADKRKKI